MSFSFAGGGNNSALSPTNPLAGFEGPLRDEGKRRSRKKGREKEKKK